MRPILLCKGLDNISNLILDFNLGLYRDWIDSKLASDEFATFSSSAQWDGLIFFFWKNTIAVAVLF